uniref:ATP-binding cassette domain-containing protein n=1 Tax=Klebsiella pneumoniae TaxID=573 RepID=UPI003D6D769C
MPLPVPDAPSKAAEPARAVIDARELVKSFQGNVAVGGMSLRLGEGEMVGLIGPNGAGKTTLFKMITGAEKPDGGTISVGETVKLGYVDQSRDALDPNATVWQEVSGGNDII